jgi:hypothetical protein
MGAYICIDIYIYLHVFVCVCVYIYIYIYIYIHAHTHIYTKMHPRKRAMHMQNEWPENTRYIIMRDELDFNMLSTQVHAYTLMHICK